MCMKTPNPVPTATHHRPTQKKPPPASCEPDPGVPLSSILQTRQKSPLVPLCHDPLTTLTGGTTIEPTRMHFLRRYRRDSLFRRIPMPIARLPTSKLVAALLEQKNTKRRLLRVLTHKYHDPTEQISRDTFAELVASALAEDCAFSHDELIAAARDVFDTKILASKTLSVSPRDSVSARETLSLYRFGFTAAAGLPEPIGLPESVQRTELATPLRDAARIYERGGLMSPRIARSHGDAALSPRAGAHSPLVLPPDADGLIGPRGPNAKTKVGRADEEGSAPGAAGRRSPSGPPSTETLLRLVQARLRTQAARVRAKLERISIDRHGAAPIDEIIRTVREIGSRAHPPLLVVGAAEAALRELAWSVGDGRRDGRGAAEEEEGEEADVTLTGGEKKEVPDETDEKEVRGEENGSTEGDDVGGGEAPQRVHVLPSLPKLATQRVHVLPSLPNLATRRVHVRRFAAALWTVPSPQPPILPPLPVPEGSAITSGCAGLRYSASSPAVASLRAPAPTAPTAIQTAPPAIQTAIRRKSLPSMALPSLPDLEKPFHRKPEATAAAQCGARKPSTQLITQYEIMLGTASGRRHGGSGGGGGGGVGGGGGGSGGGSSVVVGGGGDGCLPPMKTLASSSAPSSTNPPAALDTPALPSLSPSSSSAAAVAAASPGLNAFESVARSAILKATPLIGAEAAGKDVARRSNVRRHLQQGFSLAGSNAMLLKLRTSVREWALHAVSQVQQQQVQQAQQRQQRRLQQNAAKRAADAQAVGPISVTGYLNEVFHQVREADDH